jgi:hypothetical protein
MTLQNLLRQKYAIERNLIRRDALNIFTPISTNDSIIIIKVQIVSDVN